MGKHKEWRKIAKKMMRKRKRALKAKERDEQIRKEEERRAQSPSYRLWLEEQEKLELFRLEEEERLRQEQNERWLKEEELAKERWEKQQKRLERLKVEKAKQELIIREEWEKEQQKLREEAEAREREKERKEREEAELMDRIEKYISGESERLPSSARTVTETQPGCPECPFFSKVAACRFRDSCSRNHIRPSVSRTLLLPGFYSHFRMDHMNQLNEYDTDVGLEFDEREIYQDFLEFYDDVLAELKTFGSVVQFKVCCNIEPHLRGNVYVQYSDERFAIKAFRALQGRYYGGKRISVEFCNIPSWSRALCGLFSHKKCPKGSKCNFLHVFRNPGREFYKADRDLLRDSSPPRSIRETTDWNWSPSPEPPSRSRRERKSRTEAHSDRYSVRENRSRRTSRERHGWSSSPSPERRESSKSSEYRSDRYSERASYRSGTESSRNRRIHAKSVKRPKDDRKRSPREEGSKYVLKKKKKNTSRSRSISSEKR